MYWCLIKNDYIDYLKAFEPRIPNINYGETHIKPFFAPLFKKDGLVYVTQVTSPKPRHYKMNNSLDFQKLFAENRLIGAVNLNYMFPVPVESIIPISKNNIHNFVKFNDDIEKSKYLRLLNNEMNSINKLHIDDKAIRLYNRCNDKPNDVVTRRCLDFPALEQKCLKYQEMHQQNINIKPPKR